MYTIINKTTGKNYSHIAHWPMMLLEYMLDNGDELIVISTFSNTIKIPVERVEHGDGESEWTWREFKYTPVMF